MILSTIWMVSEMALVIYILTVSFSHSLFVISVLWLPPDSLPEKHGLQIKLNSHTAPNLLGFILLQESVAEPSSYPSHTLTSVFRSPVSPIIASFTSVLQLSSTVSTLTSGDPFENRYDNILQNSKLSPNSNTPTGSFILCSHLQF